VNYEDVTMLTPIGVKEVVIGYGSSFKTTRTRTKKIHGHPQIKNLSFDRTNMTWLRQITVFKCLFDCSLRQQHILLL